MDLFRSANHVLKEHLQTSCKLSTSCKEIDQIMGGGFCTSSVTQISGASGTGKTQLCFQLCVNVQLPVECGGLDGDALFIDTNKTFSSNRICEMAQHTLLKSSMCKIPNKMCPKDFLAGIHVYECMHGVELYGISQRLLSILETFCQVRLIIIDNLASALRSEEDISHRTKLLTAIGDTLRRVASVKNVAIVLTNQVTTKFRVNNDRGVVFPALGELWSYFPDTKLSVYRMQQKRSIILEKSPTRPLDIADFYIDGAGIRSVNHACSSNFLVKCEVKSQPTKHLTDNDLENSNKQNESEIDDNLLQNLCSPWVLTQADDLSSPSSARNECNADVQSMPNSTTTVEEKVFFPDSGCQSYLSVQSTSKPPLPSKIIPCSTETSDLSLTSDDFRPLSPVIHCTKPLSPVLVCSKPSSPILSSNKRPLSPVLVTANSTSSTLFSNKQRSTSPIIFSPGYSNKKRKLTLTSFSLQL